MIDLFSSWFDKEDEAKVLLIDVLHYIRKHIGDPPTVYSSYPQCGQLVIQYVETKMKPHIPHTKTGEDYDTVWEEILIDFREGKHTNLVTCLAKWTMDMHADGVDGITALFRAEGYNSPAKGYSYFPFNCVYHGKICDMTFAAHAVRTMFLEARPGLAVSISGLEGRQLLQRMEDLMTEQSDVPAKRTRTDSDSEESPHAKRAASKEASVLPEANRSGRPQTYNLNSPLLRMRSMLSSN